MTLNREHTIRNTQFLILLLLFTYDAFTYLPESVSMSTLKVLYYGLILGLSFFVAFLTKNEPIKSAPSSPSLLLKGWFIFVLLYLIRVSYDLFILHIPQTISTHAFTIPFLFTCATFLPMYGFKHFKFSLLDFVPLAKVLMVFFGALITLSVYYFLTGQAEDYIWDDGRLSGNASLDTIAFGHLGLSLCIISSFVLHHEWRHSKPLSIVALCFVLLGLFVIFGAGSRGAMVAAIVCVLFLLAVKGHGVFACLFIPTVLAAFYFLFPVLNELFESFNNGAIQRLYDTLFAANDVSNITTERDLLFAESINHTLDYPFLGYSFILHGSYVHNFILEAFQALGIFGGLLFVILNLSCIRIAFKLAKNDANSVLIAILYIQYTVYSYFSRSMSILPVYWTLTFLLIYKYLDFQRSHAQSIHHHPNL